MLTLLLAMALLVIAVGIVVPSITFDIKRDREEEMIHRGTQYTRAVRAYYRKFGRYPVKVEDLENTNQMRFLRKRYKDPITGQDFRLLHFGEVKMSMNALMPMNTAPSGPINGAPGFTQGPATNTNSGLGGNSNLGGNPDSGFGQNAQPNPLGNQTGSNTSQGGDVAPGTILDSSSSSSSSGDKLGGMTFGGMPIIGVASTSASPSIREFDHKRKYKEWAFVYDPTFDRGLLITTPYQPQLQMFGQQAPNLNGQNGANQPTGFGVTIGNPSTGLQNNPNQPTTSGFGNNNPQNPPQQQ